MWIIGIGTDIVPVERIGRIAGRDEEVFLKRVLGDRERAGLATRARGRSKWSTYARHVAAKESFFKALGTGLVGRMSWRDVEVIYDVRGHDLRISGETARELEAAGVTRHWLSMGSTEGLAIALVVLAGGDVDGSHPPEGEMR